MVNPGAFKGTRRKFLEDQTAIYADAVVKNHVADTVSDIQRRYFKRYPITLPHDEEPSEDWLAQVDDSAPDEDFAPPDQQKLDNDSYQTALTTYNERLKLIKIRKDQIARRLKYQYSKSQDVPSKFQGNTDDPMFVLMANLTGIASQKPRRKTGYHVWAPSNRPSLDSLVEEKAKASNISGRQKAGLHTQVYKEAYDKLDEDERADWESKASEQYDEAVAKFEQALSSPPSTTPEDRQRIITGLPKFVQPILDLIADYTGWKATLIAGGPEPAENGRLNMISMHSGTTSGSVAMNFGQSERGPYKQFVVPVFANFLKKCYTVEECRAAALPTEHESLADTLKADSSNWEIHSMDDYVRLSGLSKTTTPSAQTATPRQPLRDYQEKDTGGSEVPEKVGPPIHAQRATSGPASTTLSSRPIISLPPRESTPSPSRRRSRHAPPLTSRTAPCAPSPAPSRAPSPAPSHAPSHAPSRAPSPAPSRALSPAPSRGRSLAPPAMLEQGGKVPQKRPRDLDESDLRRRMRLRLSKMQDESNINAIVPASSTISSTGATNMNSEVAASSISNSSCVHSTAAPSSTPSVRPPAVPPLAPEWFKLALALLCSDELGDAWMKLLTLWTEFEEKSLYTENGMLGTQGRPPFVAEWIRYARSPKYRPKKLKLNTTQQMFWAWWRSLQPEWRTEDGGTILPRTDGDLAPIRKPGKNGLFSVLAALFYWGLAAGGKEGCGGENDWTEAVDDIDWVIRGLLSESPEINKPASV